MRISIRLGAVFLLLLTLAGCSTVNKYLTFRFWEAYKTDIEAVHYDQELDEHYGRDIVLRLEDDKKAAFLFVQESHGLVYMGHTDKALLPVWNSLFDEFLAWTPSPGEVVDKTSVVKKKVDGVVSNKTLKFMVIDGKKQLVFIASGWITDDNLYAFDEDKVRQLKALYQQLDDILI